MEAFGRGGRRTALTTSRSLRDATTTVKGTLRIEETILHDHQAEKRLVAPQRPLASKTLTTAMRLPHPALYTHKN